MNRKSPIPLWAALSIGVVLVGGIYAVAQRTIALPETSGIVRPPAALASPGASVLRTASPAPSTTSSVPNATSSTSLKTAKILVGCQPRTDGFQFTVPADWIMGCVELADMERVYVLTRTQTALVEELSYLLHPPSGLESCDADCVLLFVLVVPAGESWDRAVVGYDGDFYSATSFRGGPAYEFEFSCAYCNRDEPARPGFDTTKSLSFPSRDRTRVYRVVFSVRYEEEPSFQAALPVVTEAYRDVLDSFDFVPG